LSRSVMKSEIQESGRQGRKRRKGTQKTQKEKGKT
jgi:hypothetical protein